MKFGKTLRAYEAACSGSLRKGALLPYKQLQSLLRNPSMDVKVSRACLSDPQVPCALKLNQTHAERPDSFHALFLVNVETAVQRASVLAQAEMKGILRDYNAVMREVEAHSGKKSLQRFLHRVLHHQSHRDEQRTVERLHDISVRAARCITTAKMNTTAVRKLMKKHDKIFRGTSGHQFNASLQAKAAFHSPMLTELCAICALTSELRDRMTQGGHCATRNPLFQAAGLATVPAALDDLAAPPQGAGAAPPDDGAREPACCAPELTRVGSGRIPLVRTQSDRFLLDNGSLSPLNMTAAVSGAQLSEVTRANLQCPICLDVMYEPIGLSCGHVLCGPCLKEYAGRAHLKQSVKAFLAKNVHRPLCCPQCRAPKSLQNAARLEVFGSLIARLVPEEMQARARSAAEHAKAASSEGSAGTLQPPPDPAAGHAERRFHPLMLLV